MGVPYYLKVGRLPLAVLSTGPCFTARSDFRPVGATAPVTATGAGASSLQGKDERQLWLAVSRQTAY